MTYFVARGDAPGAEAAECDIILPNESNQSYPVQSYVFNWTGWLAGCPSFLVELAGIDWRRQQQQQQQQQQFSLRLTSKLPRDVTGCSTG